MGDSYGFGEVCLRYKRGRLDDLRFSFVYDFFFVLFQGIWLGSFFSFFLSVFFLILFWDLGYVPLTVLAPGTLWNLEDFLWVDLFFLSFVLSIRALWEISNGWAWV